jgi:hypothetical protein
MPAIERLSNINDVCGEHYKLLCLAYLKLKLYMENKDRLIDFQLL